MHGIARLLFGDGPAGRDGSDRGSDSSKGTTPGSDPFGPGDGWDLAERAREAGQWCGSTPGADAIARALGDAGRPGRPRR